jgi:hypothetical protein
MTYSDIRVLLNFKIAVSKSLIYIACPLPNSTKRPALICQKIKRAGPIRFLPYLSALFAWMSNAAIAALASAPG